MSYSRVITHTAKMARSSVRRPLGQSSINIPRTVRTQTNFVGGAYPKVAKNPISPTISTRFQILHLNSSPLQQAVRNFGSYAAGSWFGSYADKYGLDDLGLDDHFNANVIPVRSATPKSAPFDANNWENSLLFSGNVSEPNADWEMDSVDYDSELEVVPLSKNKNLNPPPMSSAHNMAL